MAELLEYYHSPSSHSHAHRHGSCSSYSSAESESSFSTHPSATIRITPLPVASLQTMLAFPDVLLVDVRDCAQYRRGHIIGAVHLSIPTIFRRRLLKKTKGPAALDELFVGQEHILRKRTQSALVIVYDDCTRSVADNHFQFEGKGEGPAPSDQEESKISHDKMMDDLLQAPAVETSSTATSSHSSSSKTCGGASVRVSNKTVLCALCEHLLAEGLRVYFLEGGYDEAEQCFPALITRDAGMVNACMQTPIPTVDATKEQHRPLTHSPQLSSICPAHHHHQPHDNEDSPQSPILHRKRHASACKEFRFIFDLLAVGSEHDAHDVSLLRREGITHVLNLTGNPCLPDVKKLFRWRQVELHDSLAEDLLVHLKSVIDFIEDARQRQGKILVHCFAGVSRSVAVAIAYVMWRQRVSFEAATSLVQAHREGASPNLNFVAQLLTFGTALAEGIHLDSTPDACPASPSSSRSTTSSPSPSLRTSLGSCSGRAFFPSS